MMKRFMGMMPSSEVHKSRQYVDSIGLVITIQAGPNGWTILYADSSSEFKDVEDTTEKNFDAALKILKKQFKGLKEYENPSESIDVVPGEDAGEVNDVSEEVE